VGELRKRSTRVNPAKGVYCVSREGNIVQSLRLERRYHVYTGGKKKHNAAWEKKSHNVGGTLWDMVGVLGVVGGGGGGGQYTPCVKMRKTDVSSREKKASCCPKRPNNSKVAIITAIGKATSSSGHLRG